MLKPLLGSGKKEKILLFIFTHVESYAREIARAFNFNLNTVQSQLLNLEIGGILYSKTKGKVRLFGINPRYPFKKEMEELLKKALIFVPDDEKRKFYTPRLRPRRTGKPL
ncbi:helix-turn-helix transcriptional regulator [bacterium]|nr:helix-turn-helix transcriptional regulator [bacterium]